MSDMVRTCLHCWTRSSYDDVHTKKWWKAQQTIAEALDGRRMYMGESEREALVEQWRSLVTP